MESRPRGPLSVIIPPSVPIFANLHQRHNKMKWRDFLPVPKRHRRKRSKARSEVGSNEDGAGQVALRPTESTPDLGIGASILPVPTPLTSRSHVPKGARMRSPRLIHLTTHFSHNTDPTLASDQTQSIPGRDGGNQPKSSDHTVDPKAVPENKTNWKSTAYATTKLAINIAKESSDAFPPLKSVLGGLSAILDHCDVYYAPPISPCPLCL